MAVCIPLACGFPTKIEQDAPGPGRMCPHCHNAAVISGKSKTKFEFCFVPLFPISSSRIWFCTICRWEMPQGDGPDPQPPGMFGNFGGFPQQMRPPPPMQH